MPAACLVLPATAALLIIAEPIIIGLFHSGAFSQDDGKAAAAALIAYAIGLPAFVGLKLTGGGTLCCPKSAAGDGNIADFSWPEYPAQPLSDADFRVCGAGSCDCAGILDGLYLAAWLARAERLDKTALRAVFLSLFCAGIMAAGLYFSAPFIQTALFG